jgi:DNA-binding CsgD family transcriptional regulator
MAILHSRLHAMETGSILLVSSGLTASLFLNLAHYYLRAILTLPAGTAPFLNFIGISLAVLIYAGAVRLLLAADPSLRRASLGVTAGVLVVQIARTIIYVWFPPSISEAVHFPAIALVSAYLLYVGIVLYRAGRRGDRGTVNALLRRVGLLLLIFAPVSTLLYGLIDLVPPEARPYVSLDFLFMVVLSAIAISVFVRHLAMPQTLMDSDALSAGFIRAFGITPREAEVIGLVGRGLSNKEIADRMHVSLTTTRTHLYNIFQKTGAGSRVDLLRIAGGYPE